MQPQSKLRFSVLLGVFSCMAALASRGGADDSSNITVVSSKVSADYKHAQLSDGSLEDEPYAFANGGHWTGTTSDASIDRLNFMDVARTMAVPLAHQNYVPSHDPKTTKLLVVVYWGRTRTPEAVNDSAPKERLQDASAKANDAKNQSTHQFYNDSGNSLHADGTIPCIRYAAVPTDLSNSDDGLAGSLGLVAAQNRSRDEIDAQNAEMLGFDSWWTDTDSYKGTPLEYRRQDLLEVLEHDRYFVVVMAYDFQLMWKQKKHKLLWETRFSVRQRGNDFDKRLAVMAADASAYFGKDSHGLIRKELPAGKVDVGDVKSLGIVSNR